MKAKPIIASLTLALLSLLAASAQTSTTTVPALPLSSGAAEVDQLAQSGVGDDVIRSYIGQSQTYFSLSASDIISLKNDGVSSQAVTAMLNHDAMRHSQQPTVTSASVAPTSAIPANATSVVVNPPPAPALQTEVIPVSPGPDYLWSPGWWSWDGTGWVWFGGYWGHPVRPGHVWIDGHFYHGRGVDRRHRR